MTVAMDRKPPDLVVAMDKSVRTMDPKNGWLRVSQTHISKAQVRPYRGREIPDPEGNLNLDPDRVYQLLCSPAELKKAAHTANSIPVMDGHVRTTASNPNQESIVGSTGTDAAYNHPYLDNSIAIWTDWSIDGINSRDQCELSCCYHYTAHMKPGDYEGLAYDGVMVDIHYEHVALVPEGRAGPDVVVADSKLEDAPIMKLTSKKALMARGAIVSAVRPLVAADMKLDFVTGALQGVNRTNFKASKIKIADKVAKDAKLDEDGKAALVAALDAMEKEDCGEDDDMDAEDADMKKKADDEKAAKDAAEKEEEDRKAKDKAARDAMTEEERAMADKKAKDAEADLTKKTEKAMDAAISAAVTRGVKAATDRMESLAKAKADVAPLIGEVVGMDSADAVYDLALDHFGVETDGLSLVAKQRMIPLLGVKPKAETVALDAAAGGDWFNKTFPHAKLGHA